MTAPGKTLAELARVVDGKVIGDDGIVIDRVSAIEEAGPGSVTFLANSRYYSHLNRCRASAVIVGRNIISDELRSGIPAALLEVADPYVGFAKILQIFSPIERYDGTISAQAAINADAVVAEAVTIFPHVFVGARAKIGARSVLFPGVFIGDDAVIGSDCILHPNVVVRHGCSVGDRVILHAGVVVGSDGFGYAGRSEGRVKIPQVGVVEIHDDVEIGANTTIDRAALGKTIIGRGSKIDNLVQIAHNVVIGEHTVIAAQAGIAGSTKIGKDVILAGQVGVVNHIQIGDGAIIGPQSGVAQTVAAGAMLSSGLAAAPHREWLKVMALLPQLPKLWNLVRALEKKVEGFAQGVEKDNRR